VADRTALYIRKCMGRLYNLGIVTDPADTDECVLKLLNNESITALIDNSDSVTGVMLANMMRDFVVQNASFGDTDYAVRWTKALCGHPQLSWIAFNAYNLPAPSSSSSSSSRSSSSSSSSSSAV